MKNTSTSSQEKVPIRPSRLHSRQLKRGKEVDVCDYENIWSTAKIISIRNDGDEKKVTIRYDGWGSEWDEVIDWKDPQRVAKAGTYTKRFKCIVSDFDKFDLWPCIINIRTPSPWVSRAEYKKAELSLTREPNVFIQPYGKQKGFPSSAWHGAAYVHPFNLSEISQKPKRLSKFTSALEIAKKDKSVPLLRDDNLFKKGSLVNESFRMKRSDLSFESTPTKHAIPDTTVTSSKLIESTNMKTPSLSSESSSDIDAEIETINPYLEHIRQKREQNEKRLKELGLNEIVKSMKPKRIPTPNRITMKKKEPLEPARRSSRKANKPVLYTGEELDFVMPGKRRPGEEFRSQTAPRKVKRKKKVDEIEPMSEEKRLAFEHVPKEDWIEDMRLYFRSIVPLSEPNLKAVMKRVEWLAEGCGVQHTQNKRAFFKKNTKIKLSDNFHSMQDEAYEWTHDNGGDPGHGWMISHPLNKCIIYQRARAENGGAFFSKSKP